jgi:endonuclease G
VVQVPFAKPARAARALLTVLLAALALTFTPAARSQDYPHLRMGNPSGAQETGDKNNFLMKKETFALSYNNQKGTPNWVSWRLAKEDLGNAPRKPFKPDLELPQGFKRITPSDYTGAGFDRGHMCPHSDRSKDDKSSQSTFVMTNMVPQSPENNQKAWNQLEMYLRDLVEKHNKVCYIIAGPAGKGGTGRNGFKVTTPNRKVTVPGKTWKVVMVLDKDVTSPGKLDEHANIRLIAVVVPNDRSPGLDWAHFRTPVSAVEELTGYKFFDQAPAELIDPLKEVEDDERIPAPTPAHHQN